MRKNEPLKNPFGIIDPNAEKKAKVIQSNPFDFPEPIQKDNSQQQDDLTGVINLTQGEDEKEILLDQQNSNNYSNDQDEDLPLLEELDITSPMLIQSRIVNVLLMKKGDTDYMDDPDLSGPMLIMIVQGLLLLLQGKIHFNYIYAFGLWGWLSLYLLMNFMIQQQEKYIAFYKILSYLGYGMSPLLLLTFISVFLNMNSTFGYIIGIVCGLWATMGVSNTFDEILGLQHRRLLIAYPLFLFYCAFVLIIIF